MYRGGVQTNRGCRACVSSSANEEYFPKSSPFVHAAISSPQLTIIIKVSNNIKINMGNTSTVQNLCPYSKGIFTNLFCCGGSGEDSCCSNNFTFKSLVGFTGVAFMPAADAEMDLGVATTGTVAISTVTTMGTAALFASATNSSRFSSAVAIGGVVGAAIGLL